MTMRAVRRIRKGEDITHSYTEPLDTVLRRQSLLQMGKFFTCNCQRCRDPTELGTFASAVLCQKCKEGFLISSDVSKLDADWLCNKCTAKMNCGRVQELAQGEVLVKMTDIIFNYHSRFHMCSGQERGRFVGQKQWGLHWRLRSLH